MDGLFDCESSGVEELFLFPVLLYCTQTISQLVGIPNRIPQGIVTVHIVEQRFVCFATRCDVSHFFILSVWVVPGFSRLLVLNTSELIRYRITHEYSLSLSLTHSLIHTCTCTHMHTHIVTTAVTKLRWL